MVRIAHASERRVLRADGLRAAHWKWVVRHGVSLPVPAAPDPSPYPKSNSDPKPELNPATLRVSLPVLGSSFERLAVCVWRVQRLRVRVRVGHFVPCIFLRAPFET